MNAKTMIRESLGAVYVTQSEKDNLFYVWVQRKGEWPDWTYAYKTEAEANEQAELTAQGFRVP